MISEETAKLLEPFTTYGVVFHASVGEGNVVGDCIFCGKEGHFYANAKTMQWDCKRCGRSGNLSGFLQAVLDKYPATEEQLKRLAKLRKLPIQAFEGLQIGYLAPDYLLPTIGTHDKVVTIQRWRPGHRVMNTARAKTMLINAQELAVNGDLFLCEGFWDMAALRWVVKRVCKERANIAALPGCRSIKKKWAHLFQGHGVYVLFDADPSGAAGEQVVHRKLSGIADALNYLHWPEEMPAGFDINDWVTYTLQEECRPLKTKKAKKQAIRQAWQSLKQLFRPAPRLLTPTKNGGLTSVEDSVERAEVWPADKIQEAYKEWLHMPEPIVLEVLFGTIMGNLLAGDPLWLFLVAPPGGTKSELLMSLSKLPNIETTTSLTPRALISGAQWQGGGDPSLIPKLDQKILVIKDFTTILTMHYQARDEIFGTLRDAYDGQIEKRFGTGLIRRYKSRFGIIAGVTPIIDSLAAAHQSLGERFLKFRLPPDTADSEAAKITQALTNINHEVEMREALQDIAVHAINFDYLDPEGELQEPTMPEEFIRKVVALAQYCAHLRGVVSRDRYTQEVTYKPTREVGTRLGKQLAKMGMGVAMFHGREEVGDHDYNVVRRVAIDTTPDRVEEVVRVVWNGTQGIYREALSTMDVAEGARLPHSTVYKVLEDLQLLRVMEKFDDMKHCRWSLSSRIAELIETAEVYSDDAVFGPKLRLQDGSGRRGRKARLKIKNNN